MFHLNLKLFKAIKTDDASLITFYPDIQNLFWDLNLV